MKIYKKAVLPKGFLASALACGIKKSWKLDLALFYSSVPARAACVFTANRIQAAPILVNKEHLKKNNAFQAVIVNSGNANCFTGRQGLADAQATAAVLAASLGIKKESVLVNSTGIIARPLPLDKIKKAIPALVGQLSDSGMDKAKLAIMTTDTFAKEAGVKFDIGKKEITISGIAKGAGMIAPNMATMLAFIFTDADISQAALKKALGQAVDNSFNCITVDGCMSTNDTVAILANGLAFNPPISGGKSLDLFTKALYTVCLDLAKMVIRDAEGASKFIRIKVTGAASLKDAKRAALSIANSNLVKAAIYGENPNFGRIAAAVGASGIAAREEDIKIKVSPLNRREIDIAVSVGKGKGSAVVYTSDLTPEYIKINAEYN